MSSWLQFFVRYHMWYIIYVSSIKWSHCMYVNLNPAILLTECTKQPDLDSWRRGNSKQRVNYMYLLFAGTTGHASATLHHAVAGTRVSTSLCSKQPPTKYQFWTQLTTFKLKVLRSEADLLQPLMVRFSTFQQFSYLR